MQTQLARAIAGEARAAFISVGPSDILSKFVGESEASVRSIFRKGETQAVACFRVSNPYIQPMNKCFFHSIQRCKEDGKHVHRTFL